MFSMCSTVPNAWLVFVLHALYIQYLQCVWFVILYTLHNFYSMAGLLFAFLHVPKLSLINLANCSSCSIQCLLFGWFFLNNQFPLQRGWYIHNNVFNGVYSLAFSNSSSVSTV
jgi:hypothetical protein